MPLALAALSAGAIGGVHCVGMCGGISSLLSQNASARTGMKVIPIANSRIPITSSACKSKPAANTLRYQFLLHSGRLLTYMLIGAVFGAMGAAGVIAQPYLPLQQIFYVMGNLALLLLGFRLLGLRPALMFFEVVGNFVQRLASAFLPGMLTGAASPLLVGMSWGCLPCGLLFGIAPFAFLSGDAYSGALLMLLFGLAALPHLLFVQSLHKWNPNARYFGVVRGTSAAILILIALFGLWHFDMQDMPGFLCITPM
ncbi:sulfite exporter TauE/SafE family protein [Undibacterium sp. Ren11W]|uniref:sulfite exporter TauE/SafE family protein n=1 Tax=Undibacterium sp. Ren11W TaxID=3413045 RepID=UPI003BF4EABD